MSLWSWAAASSRGTSHEHTNARLQDAYACFIPSDNNSDYFAAIVCDGAGSAPMGGQGASIICRVVGHSIRHHFQSNSTPPAPDQFTLWIDDARDRIFAIAERRMLAARDFATTMVCAVANGSELIVAHVGDGCVVLHDAALDTWLAPTWPDHGEYASTTSFVTDDPAPKLRINRYSGSIDSVVLFTDGLERLALDFANSKPHEPFFSGVCRPLQDSTVQGRDRTLSRQLKEYLNSPVINARTDDDKTLVLAVRK